MALWHLHGQCYQAALQLCIGRAALAGSTCTSCWQVAGRLAQPCTAHGINAASAEISAVPVCFGVQVNRANKLLSVYRAVAALRADEQFQEDAADPRVQAALQDMGRNNNMDK